jgi:hypothetical protein
LNSVGGNVVETKCEKPPHPMASACCELDTRRIYSAKVAGTIANRGLLWRRAILLRILRLGRKTNKPIA